MPEEQGEPPQPPSEDSAQPPGIPIDPVPAPQDPEPPSSEAAAPAETPAPARPVDPWAHRRGEPRIFALLWTIFLFVATVSIFFATMAGPAITPDLMRPAALLLLLLTTIGITVLWPMTRLSQVPDPHPLSGSFQDLIVVMVPAQALIWPQTLWWLARWPLSTVAAIAVSLAVWGCLVGGLLALAQAGRQRPGRHPVANTGWMCTFVVLVLGGVVVSLLRADGGGLGGPSPAGDVYPPPVDAALMLSPIGSILELTRDISWSGRATPLTPWHWQLIALTGVVSAIVWIAAAIRSRRARAGLRFSCER